MRTTKRDLIWIDVALTANTSLQTVAQAVQRALGVELRRPTHADEDDHDLVGEVMGVEVSLGQRSQGIFALRGSISPTRRDGDSRTVSLSDFIRDRLNAGDIVGWTVGSFDQGELDRRFFWDGATPPKQQ